MPGSLPSHLIKKGLVKYVTLTSTLPAPTTLEQEKTDHSESRSRIFVRGQLGSHLPGKGQRLFLVTDAKSGTLKENLSRVLEIAEYDPWICFTGDATQSPEWSYTAGDLRMVAESHGLEHVSVVPNFNEAVLNTLRLMSPDDLLLVEVSDAKQLPVAHAAIAAAERICSSIQPNDDFWF
ncbi:MAG: hypothetical protein KDA80_02040 [Planctomycetaceae bacterium]|nr:hypothetical protein [Planctomycetaceae bacterium]